MHIKTDAIVLRSYDNGKNSKLLLLLTRDMGRIAVTARGAGSLKSALCAASGQFCYASFVLFKNADRYIVESADIKELFFELRNDVTALATAQYMAEVAGEIAQEEERDEDLLRILLNALYGLAKLKLSPKLCKCVFELKAVACEGYTPELAECLVCGSDEGVAIDIMQGQILCREHKDESAMPLTKEAIACLDEIFSLPIERMFSFSASAETQAQITAFSQAYLLAQTDLAPKTLSFLKTLL